MYPEEGIHDLQDWLKLFRVPGSTILNEYGDSLHANMLLGIIRRVGYPYQLKHYPLDKWCVGQRDTYDLITGDFS